MIKQIDGFAKVIAAKQNLGNTQRETFNADITLLNGGHDSNAKCCSLTGITKNRPHSIN